MMPRADMAPLGVAPSKGVGAPTNGAEGNGGAKGSGNGESKPSQAATKNGARKEPVNGGVLTDEVDADAAAMATSDASVVEGGKRADAQGVAAK